MVAQFVPAGEPVLRYSLLLCAIETSVAVVGIGTTVALEH